MDVLIKHLIINATPIRPLNPYFNLKETSPHQMNEMIFNDGYEDMNAQYLMNTIMN